MQIVDIPGYEGMYAVDEMGNVYSLEYGKGRKLRPGINSVGYLTVKLFKDKKQKNFKVHRLVAKAFLSNYSEALQVDHIDQNRINNKLSNLRMVTNQENAFNNNAKGYVWDKEKSKWKAYIRKDYKLKHLGYFDKEDDAREAYLAAKQIYHVIT